MANIFNQNGVVGDLKIIYYAVKVIVQDICRPLYIRKKLLGLNIPSDSLTLRSAISALFRIIIIALLQNLNITHMKI